MIRSTPLALALGLLTTCALARLVAAQGPSTPGKGDPLLVNAIEVQTRGPLHEAFAQPLEAKPEPGQAIPKEPPPLVPEEPPEQKPEADNAQWIPGYWAWDSERQEYMWVSGVYRVPPQGRTFVPGYWTETADGWRWVAGFWSSQQQQEMPFTPQPPNPLDNGPSLPAPDDNSTYIPGGWVFRDLRWLWRPGYWSAFQTGRVWIPPHYVWTPNGYLFVDGYWDYPLEDRGLVFAPVYFLRPLWTDPTWAYQPNYVVNFPSLFDSSFVLGGSFYFGNYHGPNYARLGFRPWYAGAGRYDPAFAYHGWRTQRNNPNWIAGVQKTYLARGNGQLSKTTPIVAPLNQAAGLNQVRLAPTSSTQRSTFKAGAQQSRAVAVKRRQLEAVRPVGAQTLKLATAANAKTGSARPTTNFVPNTIKVNPSTNKTLQAPVQPRIHTPAPATAKIVTPPAQFKKTSVSTVHPKPAQVQVHRPAPSAPRPSAAVHTARTVHHAPAHSKGGSSRPSGGHKR